MLQVIFIKLIQILLAYFSCHSKYTECDIFKYPDPWVGEQTPSHITTEIG